MKGRESVCLLAAVAAFTSLSGAAHANLLVVTATGTVHDDYDTSGIFGFGVSPVGTHDVPAPNTAAGQAVSMSFTLDLDRIPTDVCQPYGACSNPGNRAYYFTNQALETSWIASSVSIGGNVVPNFTAGDPFGFACAELWTAYNGTTYNEFLAGSSLEFDSRTDVGPDAYTHTIAAASTFLRVDYLASTFLTGLALNQTFEWTAAQSDSWSTAFVSRDLTVGGCVNSVCQDTQLVHAYAAITLDSVHGEIVPVPEPGALWLMLMGLVGIVGVRRRLTPTIGASHA